jgi:hypothetical protein
MFEMITQEGAKLYGYCLLFNPDDFYRSPAVPSRLSGCSAAFAPTTSLGVLITQRGLTAGTC